MRLKNLFVFLFLTLAFVCGFPVFGQVAPSASYEDGVYRGGYGEVENQVFIEFVLKSNKVERIAFRNLAYRGIDYRTSTDETVKALSGQYQMLINYLVGKDIRTALQDLYKPGNIVTTPVKTKTGNPVRSNADTFSGATLRSGKIISAIRDALNRGVYSY